MGEQKQLVYPPFHLLRPEPNPGQRLALLFMRSGPLDAQIRLAEDEREGSSDLVRRPAEELPVLRLRLLEAFEQLVELRPQAADLVRRMLHRHALVQGVRRNAADGFAQGTDGC